MEFVKWLRNILQRRLQRKIDKKLKEIADTISLVEEKGKERETQEIIDSRVDLKTPNGNITFFGYDKGEIEESVKRMMDDCIINEDYEAAAIYRDILNER